MSEEITVEVFRYRPEESEEPGFERFTVPARREWMVLDALNHIKDTIDGSLSYRWACRMGVCGSCGMTVNGEPVLTCATYLSDLIGDIQDFIRKLKRVKAWIVRDEEGPLSEGEYRQTPAELARYKQYSMCINCMLCYAACPIYPLEPEFIGPAAIALAQRYNLDSRDEGSAERMDVLSQDDGIWSCTFVGECSVVCPKNVDPAGAIQRYKVQATGEWYKSLLMPWRRR